MCIVPTAPTTATSSPARRLPPSDRQQLALDALAGQPIAELAREHEVSRKFVYQQADKARDALQQAFTPPSPPQQEVLFYLPVTKAWIRQFVLALVLICHCSLRNVVELLRDLFDYPISVGTVHNIVQEAVVPARAVNDRQDLSRVRIGSHDEIFQARHPVLVGACAHSTYCYLLSQEEHRDADTWALRLLELTPRNFHPQATIADFAGGLRAGQERALPGVPCRGDVFHVLYEIGPVVRFLENRAYDAIACCAKLQHQQAQTERRKGRRSQSVAQKLRHAWPVETQAVALAEDVALLVRWLREDVLTVAGPDYAGRRELYDFILAELRVRMPLCPHRLKPVCTLLENQREELLAFVAALDAELAALSAEYAISAPLAREVLNVQAMDKRDTRRWQREAVARQQLGKRYYAVNAAVEELTAQVVRASSLIENLNSRLRNYFFLRRQLGPDYLTLLQFFLNHRRFLRSEHPDRVDKSPAELLTGEELPHWLEMLGFTRFKRL
jgi:hypothetical protein